MLRSYSSRALTASRMRWAEAMGILGLADVGAFARQPQDDVLAADGVGDVDGALAALDGVLALGGAVGGVGAVDGLAVFPQARGDELAEEPLAVEDLLDLGRRLHERLRVGVDLVGRHDVVVVELDAVEAELLVLADLGGEGDFLADGRAEGVGAGADVPGAEGEAVGGFFRGGGHSSFLRVVPKRIGMRSLRMERGAGLQSLMAPCDLEGRRVVP